MNLHFFFTEMEEIGVYERDHFSVMKKKVQYFVNYFFEKLTDPFYYYRI